MPTNERYFFQTNAARKVLIHFYTGLVRFTKEPPKILYVFTGHTVRLVWEYHVDNRLSEFDINSPKWNFYTSQGSVMNIASEDLFQNWKWVIHRDTCPPRLLNPTRVFKESLATLVIKNVSAADSGIYGCSLVLLRTSTPINSKVMLSVLENVSVTSLLRISTTATRSKQATTVPTLKENATDLDLQKNSTQPMQPTWPSLKESHLINKTISDNILKSWTNKSLVLRCFIIGAASPNITWYNPTGHDITNASQTTKEGSRLSVITSRTSDYGIYTCRAQSIFGFDEHKINVTDSCLCPTVKNRQMAKALRGPKHSRPEKGNPGSKNKKLYIVCLGVLSISWVMNVFLILKLKTINKTTRFKAYNRQKWGLNTK